MDVHGRVIHLYYELCEKIWGGSPATEQIEMGIQTKEVNQQMAMSEREPDYDETEDNSELTQLSDTTSHYDSQESSTSGDQNSQSNCRDGGQSNSSSHKQREKNFSNIQIQESEKQDSC